MLDKTVFIAYGAILIIGGFFGWKAGSKVSLIAGSISGLLIFLSFFLLNSNIKAGFYLFGVVSVLLCVSFLMRFLKTHNFMPSGMLLMLSVLAVIFAVARLSQLK